MYIKPLFIVMVLFSLSLNVLAASKQANYESVLTPGARLVAGDLTKNEFFILGKDEPNPKGPKKAPVVDLVAMNKEEAIAKAPLLAVNKKQSSKAALPNASNKEKLAAGIQIATRKSVGKKPMAEIDVYKAYAANSKISPARVKTAFAENSVKKIKPLNKKLTTDLAAAYKIKKSVIYQTPKAGKKKMTNVKTVLKQSPQKLTRKKVTSHLAMLNQTKHKAKTNKAVTVKV